MAKLVSLCLLIGILAPANAGSPFGKLMGNLRVPKDVAKQLQTKSLAEMKDAAAKSASGAQTAVAKAAASPQSVVDFGKDLAAGSKAGDVLSNIPMGLDTAGDVLKRVSGGVVAANASDMGAAVAPLGPGSSPLADAVHWATSASKGDVADGIRDTIPKASKTLEDVSHTIERTLPKVTELVNNSGSSLATAIGGAPKPSAPAEGDLVGDGDEEFTIDEGEANKVVWGMAGAVFLASVSGIGYCAMQRAKASARAFRAPILLSDALDGANGDSPQGRGSAMQMSTADEAAPFSRF